MKRPRSEPVIKRPELLAKPVLSHVQNHGFEDFSVFEIDPKLARGEDVCHAFDIPFTHGGNCIVVDGFRRDAVTRCACLIPVGKRLAINSVVRKALDARKVRLANHDDVVQTSAMEYGSITPFGLPSDWTIIVDSSFENVEWLVVGSGRVHAKLLVTNQGLRTIPSLIFIEGLAQTP